MEAAASALAAEVRPPLETGAPAAGEGAVKNCAEACTMEGLLRTARETPRAEDSTSVAARALVSSPLAMDACRVVPTAVASAEGDKVAAPGRMVEAAAPAGVMAKLTV